MKKIVYPLLWDKMPIDISFVFNQDKPAGNHGFIHADGEDFIFDDGTKMKFWGVNVNAGANFPEHAHAEKVARRMAMTGVNLVRLHQLDAEWGTPNIFQFTKGALKNDTQSFDSESMDRLDYWVYSLKEQGIYIYMDLLTYRRFRQGDGVVGAEKMLEQGQPYAEYDEHMIELQKKFQKDFFLHYNPYTKMCYKDDPCIIMCGLTNEAPFVGSRSEIEPYKTNLTNMYIQFCKERNVEVSKDVDINEQTPLIREFQCNVQRKYYALMRDYLRELGYKGMIVGTNLSDDKSTPFCNADLDYTDSHSYCWNFKKVIPVFENKSMTKSPDTLCKLLGQGAVANKPFFVSEWDEPWPMEYRAEATLVTAAIGALQNWAGFAIHTYCYRNNESEATTQRVGQRLVLGGKHYRGIFDTYNDPAKFGLFYHAALLTRRGDVKAADTTVICGLSEEEIYAIEPDVAKIIPPAAVEEHKLRFAYNCKSENSFSEHKKDVLSDTRQLYRNWEEGFGYIDTDMTKAVYGFIGGRKLELDGFCAQIDTDFATVAISSLSDKAISQSDNLLLTTVGRANNTNVRYNEDMTVIEDEGTAPVMAEVICGKIRIKTDNPNMKVWSVNYEGFFTGVIESEYKDGYLEFTIGEKFESIYYLIQAQ